MRARYIFGIAALVLVSLFAIYCVVTLENPATDHPKEQAKTKPNTKSNTHSDEQLNNECNETTVAQPFEQSNEQLNVQSDDKYYEQLYEKLDEKLKEEFSKLLDIKSFQNLSELDFILNTNELIAICIKIISNLEENDFKKLFTKIKTDKFKIKKTYHENFADEYGNYLIKLIREIFSSEMDEFEIDGVKEDCVMLSFLRSIRKNTFSDSTKNFLITFKFSEDLKDRVILRLAIENIHIFKVLMEESVGYFEFYSGKSGEIGMPKNFFVQFKKNGKNFVSEDLIIKNLVDDSFSINVPVFEIFGKKYKLTYIFVWKNDENTNKWALLSKDRVISTNASVKTLDQVLGWNISFGIVEEVV